MVVVKVSGWAVGCGRTRTQAHAKRLERARARGKTSIACRVLPRTARARPVHRRFPPCARCARRRTKALAAGLRTRILRPRWWPRRSDEIALPCRRRRCWTSVSPSPPPCRTRAFHVSPVRRRILFWNGKGGCSVYNSQRTADINRKKKQIYYVAFSVRM